MIKAIHSLPRYKIGRSSFGKIPATPGIYIFWNKDLPIYIGKSVNIKERLKSYLSQVLESKTAKMVSSASDISYIKVTTELEALLLEAYLIQNIKPQYNVISKDDKHALYIRITKEKYPRVVTARKLEGENGNNLAFYGPFPSSKSIYFVLRIIRKIFPFSDHKLGKRPCLYSHMELCSPCPNAIESEADLVFKAKLRKKYLENIRLVRLVLGRKLNQVSKYLTKNMDRASKAENYEEASLIKTQIERLNYITQPVSPVASFLENPNLAEDIEANESRYLKSILNIFIRISSLERIECFDVAHLMGLNPTASMVTFIKGVPEKSLYRNFRIRQPKGGDDISSMIEVAERRAKNLKTWGRPDLILVDGGKTQVSAFYKIFSKYNIPVVGLAKTFPSLVISSSIGNKLTLKEMKLKRSPALNLLERLRDEAHRFARRYHHKLIKKSLIPVS